MAGEVRAETIGRAAAGDLQIHVPRRASVRRGVRLRPVGESVVLDGADRPQRFTGAFAREHLERLVGACDGVRDHAALAAATGLSESAVFKALALLWASGVVEEAPAAEQGHDLPPEFATLLSRLGNTTGADRSWTDSAARLDRAQVAIRGDAELVGSVAEALDGLGLDLDVAPDDAVVPGRPAVVLVVAAATGNDTDGTGVPAVAEACWQAGVPVLLVRASADELVLGPWVDPTFTPCFECSAGDPAPLRSRPSGPTVHLVAGLVAHHLVALISRSTMTHLPLDAAVVDLTALRTQYRAAVTRPGCPRCSLTPGAPVADPPVGAAFEASVAIPPRRFLDPKGHLAHYQVANIGLQSRFRTWPSCPRVPLAAPDLDLLRGGHLGGPAGASQRTAALAPALSLLLTVGFGVKHRGDGDQVKRWTAAAGNIGSASAFLVVPAAADCGIEPGHYAYLEDEHALARLAGPADAPLPASRAVTVVVTANLAKVVAKYGSFGLRLGLLDSGCAVAAMREVAAHVSVDLRVLDDWDDTALAAGLGIRIDEEPIATVVQIGDLRA